MFSGRVATGSTLDATITSPDPHSGSVLSGWAVVASRRLPAKDKANDVH